MLCWNFDLYTLNTVTRNDSNSILLRLLFVNRVVWAVFQTDKPFNLRLDVWLALI